MPPAAPSSAVPPSHNSLEPLDPNQPALPRQPNPHSNCGTPAGPISAVSSLGGFRTPAAERAAPSLKRPASETLHKSGHSRRASARNLLLALGLRLFMATRSQ